ncbi:MAG: GatB/YqeY domain-containing protein [Roseovarius sp.]|nr:GatB/YqeY domain-containing protein [Roseovarius sp.]
MDLRERVNTALKQAMKDKDQGRLATLRLINAAIKDQEIAQRAKADAAPLGDAEIMAILARMTRQRQESVRAYEEGGRLDLAERERAEIKVIEEFLPRQLSQEEVGAAIDRAIADVGATSIRDMGKIMGKLKERHTGQMDFGAVGALVKARLARGG